MVTIEPTPEQYSIEALWRWHDRSHPKPRIPMCGVLYAVALSLTGLGVYWLGALVGDGMSRGPGAFGPPGGG